MNGNKSARSIVIFAALSLIVALNFFGIASYVGGLLAVCRPLVFGLLAALILKPPMLTIEKKVLRALTAKKPKLSRALSLGLTYLLSFLAITLFLYFTLPQLSDGLSRFVTKLPEIMATLKSVFSDVLIALNIDARFLDKFDETLYGGVERAIKALITAAPDLETLFRGGFAFFSDVFFALAFSGYILYDKENMRSVLEECIEKLFKQKAQRALDVFNLLVKKFDDFFSGQVIEAGILGALCFLGMLILDIPYALLVSGVIAVTAIVPLLGAIIGTVPSLFIIMMESPIKALVFLLFIIFLQLFEGNLIYPKVVGTKIDLPPFFVLLALVIGGGVFGVLGIILVVPLASVLYALYVKPKNELL